MFRRAALLGAAVLGVALVLPAQPAQAIPHCRNGYNCLYQWYADVERTEFIGLMWVDCDGTSGSSGLRSQFLDFTQSRCNQR